MLNKAELAREMGIKLSVLDKLVRRDHFPKGRFKPKSGKLQRQFNHEEVEEYKSKYKLLRNAGLID